MRVAVKGLGVVGGFGSGVADLRAALEHGAVPPGELMVPTGAGIVPVPAFRASTARLDEFIPKRALRRVDHYSKLGLLGASLALADAGWQGRDLDRVGVVVASGYGATATTFAFLDSLIADGDICASPTHFANSVHNAAAANISIQLAAKGPSLTVSQFELSVPSALFSAQQWLTEGRVDAVLFGAIDELSDLVGYLQLRKSGVPAAASIAPLDAERESALLGEGAAFFLLTRADADPAYCSIDAVELGNLSAGRLALPGDALLVLGADGRRDLAARYRSQISEGAPVACYAPLYGSLPAGAAFDLAAAALVLKRGCAYDTPGGCLSGDTAATGCERVAAFRLTSENDYSLITMSRI